MSARVSGWRALAKITVCAKARLTFFAFPINSHSHRRSLLLPGRKKRKPTITIASCSTLEVGRWTFEVRLRCFPAPTSLDVYPAPASEAYRRSVFNNENQKVMKGPAMKTNSHDSSIQMHLAQSHIGRILLHLACACRDHKFQWHWQGIQREFLQTHQFLRNSEPCFPK